MPDITPVAEFIESPAGRDGEILHESTFPPVLVGVRSGIAVFTARETEAGVYEKAGNVSVQLIEPEVLKPFTLA